MRAPTTLAPAVVFALVAVAAWLAHAPRGEAGTGHSLMTGQHVRLLLDGAEAGVLKSMSSKTVTPPPESPRDEGAALNGELQLQFGLDMRTALYDWIDANLKQSGKPRSGVVVSYDASGNATAQTEFSDAVLTELTIPALDAASKAAGFFTLDLVANVRSGAAPASKGIAKMKAKVWTTSQFRLEIDGLETKRVSKIEALSLRTPASGAGGPLSVRSPLRVKANVADKPSWDKWQEASARGDAVKKEGRIVFLNADFKDTLAEIKLHGLGISSLGISSQSSGPAAMFEAELRYDSLELSVPPSK
jgi:hypothetical protein